MKIRKAIGINAGVNKVWDLVSDIPKWADITGRDDLSEVQHWESGPPYAFLWRMTASGTSMRGESRYSNFEALKGFEEGWKTSSCRGRWIVSMADGQDGGTRASIQVDVKVESGIINWVMYLYRVFVLQSIAERALNALKERAEAAGE